MRGFGNDGLRLAGFWLVLEGVVGCNLLADSYSCSVRHSFTLRLQEDVRCWCATVSCRGQTLRETSAKQMSARLPLADLISSHLANTAPSHIGSDVALPRQAKLRLTYAYLDLS